LDKEKIEAFCAGVTRYAEIFAVLEKRGIDTTRLKQDIDTYGIF
jgi:hypothetical protein